MDTKEVDHLVHDLVFHNRHNIQLIVYKNFRILRSNRSSNLLLNIQSKYSTWTIKVIYNFKITKNHHAESTQQAEMSKSSHLAIDSLHEK
jgi:hypothetical protein